MDMASAKDVAEFFIQASRGEDGARGISKLGLNKLMYFAQLAYMRRYDRPLFQDDFHAWRNGPVLPSLERDGMGCVDGHDRDRVHSDFDGASIDAIPDDAYAVLPLVYMTFEIGEDDDGRLIDATHVKDGPWIDVRRANPDDPSAVIPKSRMLDYARSTPILPRDHVLNARDVIHDERGSNGHPLLPAEYEDDSDASPVMV